VERAQEIADALLDLLADQLEDVKDRQALSDEIARIMKKVDQHLEQMGTQKIERFDMASLKRNLATLHRRIDQLPRESAQKNRPATQRVGHPRDGAFGASGRGSCQENQDA
jgi:DNA anti-recombination protein RmuC